MITWPIHLPKPSQEYNVTATGQLIVTAFETGFRQRQRYAYNEDTISVSWLFTQLELDIFRGFVYSVLQGGALAFEAYIIGLDGIVTAEVYLKGGDYGITYLPGNNYRVSAYLVKVAPETITADIYHLLNNEAMASFDTFLLLSDALSFYIESVFGNSGASALVTEFLETFRT